MLSEATVVPITWDVDTDRAAIEHYAAEFGTTAYWHSIAPEYGLDDLTERHA